MRVFCGMLIAAAAAAVAPAAMAQAPAEGTSYVVTYIEVVPSAEREAAGLLKQVATASRKEAGNQRYDILQRLDHQNQFVILEAWADAKAADADRWRATAATVALWSRSPATTAWATSRWSSAICSLAISYAAVGLISVPSAGTGALNLP